MSEPRQLVRLRKLCLALPELADILRDAYRLHATKRLLSALDGPQSGRRLA